MYAVVLDGELKSALAAVRALGRAGRRVSVGSTRSTAMAGFSRFAKDRFTYPDPKLDQDRFIAHVIKAASAFPEPPVIFAFSDATYLALFAHRKELEAFAKLIFPPVKAVATAFDKAATYVLARKLSVPTIPELMLEEVREFPVVVKPKTSVSWASGEGRYGTATIATDSATLMAAVAAIEEQTGEPPVVQRFIRGTEYGVECLALEGEVSKIFVHERIRSLSPRGGAATVKRVVTEHPAMVAMVQHTKVLVRGLAWSGPIMVEWKLDTTSGTPMLMEINGRFWGSLPLPERAGLSFTLGYDVLARGYAAPKAKAIKPMTTQHFLGDCRWLWRVLTAKDPLRSLMYPTRLQALGAFLKTTITVPGDVFVFTDPLPFVIEYIDVLSRRL